MIVAFLYFLKVRSIISDFAVVIAIISMSATDLIMGLRTPKLQVPERFEPTLPSRGWLINPFGGNPVWTLIVAPLPALLATILIFMDQQITAVIINRKEHKLKVHIKHQTCVSQYPCFILPSFEIVFNAQFLLKIKFVERMWLPFGLVHSRHFNSTMFSDGHSMVCCSDRFIHESCELIENGIRIRSSW